MKISEFINPRGLDILIKRRIVSMKGVKWSFLSWIVHYFGGIGKSLSYSSTEMLFLRFAAGFSKDVKKQGREGRKKTTQER